VLKEMKHQIELTQEQYDHLIKVIMSTRKGGIYQENETYDLIHYIIQNTKDIE
jgi:mevalonate pyrophosphate decarboxylase